ncbi:MAG: PhoPQ-activated protein PqaA family protein [Singulisphaera sp.]
MTPLRSGRRVFGIVFGIVVAMIAGLARAVPTTALDDFIAAPDPTFSWSQVNTITGPGYEADVLNMTSQTWRTPADVNRTDWQHYVTVIRPSVVTSHRALLWIDGGSNGGSTPNSVDPNLLALAQSTQSVVIDLGQVPNEPLTFSGQGPRSEDALIAYTWQQYINTGDETWPAQLPMTKAAVKAMDAVQAFAASAAGGAWSLDDFVVGGGSKRGWTTWLTAAADQRVAAIIPAVADTLNVQKVFENAYNGYGFWPPAIQDYVNAGITNDFGTPQLNSLMQIVDPYSYLDRLTMPKFMINSAGDQFFTPDSSQFYFNDLQGTKYLRYVPNTDHSLNGSDAAQSMQAFYSAILNNKPLPQFTWFVDAHGALHVHTDTAPSSVLLWQANDPTARDFRFDTIGAAYTSTKLIDLGGGNYMADVGHPAQGWTAFFIELTFPSGGLFPYKFTTDVHIVGVPEPGTVALAALGGVMLALVCGRSGRRR